MQLTDLSHCTMLDEDGNTLELMASLSSRSGATHLVPDAHISDSCGADGAAAPPSVALVRLRQSAQGTPTPRKDVNTFGE